MKQKLKSEKILIKQEEKQQKILQKQLIKEEKQKHINSGVLYPLPLFR